MAVTMHDPATSTLHAVFISPPLFLQCQWPDFGVVWFCESVQNVESAAAHSIAVVSPCIIFADSITLVLLFVWWIS